MRQTALFAGIFLIGTGAFGADSQLMNLVMPDAKVLAGVNVVTAQISPFGQYVLSHVANNDSDLQSLIALTGFDPRKDVTEILVASTGSPTGQNALVLAKGSFNVSQLTDLMSREKKGSVTQYNGATLFSGAEVKNMPALAFLGNSVALAGDLASVKAAIDRSGGVNSVSPELAARVQALSTTEDAWSVSLASIGSLIPNVGDGQAKSPGAETFQLVKNIQSSSGGVKFGSTVEIVGQAVSDTPQNATALADIVRMVTSLIAMGAAQDPSAGAAGQVLQKLKIATNGPAVDINLSISEADLEALLKSFSGSGPAAGAERQRKARRL